MRQKPQARLPQLLTDLAFYPACDNSAVEGPVRGFDAIEAAALAFFEEVGAVWGFGGDEVAEGGEGGPGVACLLAVD